MECGTSSAALQGGSFDFRTPGSCQQPTTPLGSELRPRCNGDAYRDLRESLEVALKEAEIHKHVTLHTLRHTFASQMAMAGVDLHTVSELLGHSSLEMT